MRFIEKSAKTVEEAIQLALTDLGIDKDDAEIEIIEEPKNGLFGLIGNKDAIVKVSEVMNQRKEITNFLELIFEKMRLKPEIIIDEDDSSMTINLRGNDLGILIGRRGETLDSLQFISNLIINKSSDNYKKVVIDIEDYRKKRESALYGLAEKLSNKVKKTGRRISLEPMSPQERRIIHMALQNNKHINTYSEGEEPFRKVVIAPKRN